MMKLRYNKITLHAVAILFLGVAFVLAADDDGFDSITTTEFGE